MHLTNTTLFQPLPTLTPNPLYNSLFKPITRPRSPLTVPRTPCFDTSLCAHGGGGGERGGVSTAAAMTVVGDRPSVGAAGRQRQHSFERKGLEAVV